MTMQFKNIDFTQRRVSAYISRQETLGRLTETCTLRVPHYQRNYSWTESTVREFMQSIFDVVRSDASNGMHMLSHMTLHKRVVDGKAVYDIIDGQQRVTTFYLLVATLLRETTKITEGENLSRGMFQARLSGMLMRNYDEDMPANAMETRFIHALESEASMFHKLCIPAVRLADLSSNHPMVRACETITKELRRFYGECGQKDMAPRETLSREFIKMILGVATNGLEVMVTETEIDIQVNSLYEHMNSRGQGLSQCDLIRNHFAQFIEEKEFIQAWTNFDNALKAANEDCDRFLMAWILARHNQASSKDKLHKTFCTLVRDKRLIPDARTLERMTIDANRIRNYKKGRDMHGTPVDGLAWLLEIKAARQHVPLLLAAEKLERENPETFAELCDEAARTIMTTTIADGGNARYQHAWQRWAKNVSLVENGEDLDLFINEVREEDGMHGMRVRRMALKEDLVKTLKDSGQRTPWNAKIQRPGNNPQQILALSYTGFAIEKAVGNRSTAESFLKGITLEHIIPVKTAHAMEAPMDPKLFQGIVTALGNLTLLTHSENSQASNRPLANKLGCYAASSVAIARALTCPLVSDNSRARHAHLLRNLPTLPEKFDAASVETRGQKLADMMAEILIG